MSDFISNLSLLTSLSFIAVYLPLIIIPVLIAFFDFITIVLAKKKKMPPEDTSARSDDFTVLIPIFGSLSYLKNIDFLKPYGKHVIICTTTKESDAFYRDLKEVSKKYGFRIFKSEVILASSKAKPNPWRLFHNTLDQKNMGSHIITDLARDEIIRDSFGAVKTRYCIFLDGDTVAADSLHKITGNFINKDFDIASVRVLASRQKTISEKLQALEYELAMDARRIYPWLTSGASMIAKTSAINHIMSNHSLFFSGGH